MRTGSETVGDILRNWRQLRRFSQMGLANEAEISARHLSFVESGRSRPSREVLLRLAEPLQLPLRERNRLFLASGYAPPHAEDAMHGPEMTAIKALIEQVLTAQMPYPALAVDRHWTLVSANRALLGLIGGAAPHLLEPPVNVLRLSLSPDGLAPAIMNLAEWRHHILTRLRQDADTAGDLALLGLYDELKALPCPASVHPPRPPNAVAVPLVLRHPAIEGPLTLLSTTTVFGTATNVTLAELTLECFYPADAATRIALTRLGQEQASAGA
ncbi:MAG: helix-turn-helix transcriptional regulator [Rhizobiales bacterium]|nr:helix-turn-helix transcriptional regulator [Hyphomicrobiales bacterium]